MNKGGKYDAEIRWSEPAGAWASDPERHCNGVKTTLFFFERGEQGADDAKAVCHGCPVQAQCLDYALNDPSLSGIWGATSQKERKEIRRANDFTPRAARRNVKKAECGTHSGYNLHRRNGEPACRACTEARNAAEVERRARRRAEAAA